MTELSEARLHHLDIALLGAFEVRVGGRPVPDPDGAWEGNDAVRAWKSSPEFRERMAQVLQYVDDFRPTELEVVSTAITGASPLPQES